MTTFYRDSTGTNLLVQVEIGGRAVGRSGGPIDLGLATDAKSLRDAINEAVVLQTRETTDKLRLAVSQGLRGPRAPYTIKGEAGLDRRPGAEPGSVIGVIGSRWYKRRRGLGNSKWVVPLDAFEGGTRIRAVDGLLAIPSKDVQRGRDNSKHTPRDFEEAGIKLRYVPRGVFGRYAALVVDNFRRRASGKVAVAGSRTIRAGKQVTLVMFWLVPEIEIPDRLDIVKIRAESDRRLAEKIIVAMAKRGIGD